MDHFNEFKKELHALLKKYNATMGCDIDGDTHGLLYTMSVSFGSQDKWKDYELCKGNTIDANDIKTQ